MIIIIGLVILVAALVVGVAGVLGNGGSAHAVSHFSVLGYHLTGSDSALFLAGIVVGAAGLLGLSLLLAGARRTSRRGSAARRGLRQSRRETAAASRKRDDLTGQRDTARASTASQMGNGTGAPDAPPQPADVRRNRLSDLRNERAPAYAAGQSDALADQPTTEVPASASDAGVPAISVGLDAHANEPAPAD
jgi:hypothetical protein